MAKSKGAVQLTKLSCKQCGHSWYPRRPKLPQVCPICKRSNWREKKKQWWSRRRRIIGGRNEGGLDMKPFYLIVVDEDQRLFNVIGPMADDRPWNDRVVNAQKTGRLVRCFTPPDGQTRDQLITSGQHDLGLTYTDELIIA
jgi:uncharacterized OB-fold protein